MLLSSPLLLFNLEPVQAQTTPLSFQTPTPANGDDSCTRISATITFDAKGTPSASNPQRVDITNGTFQITSIDDGQILYSGNIYSGRYINNSEGGDVGLNAEANDATNNTSSCVSKGEDIAILTSCSTSDTNTINVYNSGDYQFATFHGAVECSSSQGGGITTQSSSSSSMTGTTTQDRDGDGILDTKDFCPNNPNTKCYIEGNTTAE
jgi:hypothetical protein